MSQKTFSEQFHSCTVRTPVDSCAEQRVSIAWADMNFLRIRVENGRNQKANFVCNNNGERSRKTSEGSSKLSW